MATVAVLACARTRICPGPIASSANATTTASQPDMCLFIHASSRASLAADYQCHQWADEPANSQAPVTLASTVELFSIQGSSLGQWASSRRGDPLLPSPHPRSADVAGIQRVSQSVSHVVDRDHREKDKDSWKDRRPGSHDHLILGIPQHVSPRRGGELHTKPQVAETRLGDNRAG